MKHTMAKKINTVTWYNAPLCNKWIAWTTIVAAGLALMLSLGQRMGRHHMAGKGDPDQKMHGKPDGGRKAPKNG